MRPGPSTPFHRTSRPVHRIPAAWFGLALFVISGQAHAQNQVHVVDESNGPGTDFTDVQPAVDAAVDGDIILVRPGTYGSVTVIDEGISIVGIADGLGTPPELNSLVVRDLQPDKRFVLRGFSIVHDLGIAFTAFYSFNNLGPVVVEDVDATESTGVLGGNPGALVLDSASVTFTRCTLRGLNASHAVGPFDSSVLAGPGVRVSGSTVHIYDTELIGGFGANGTISLFGVAQNALAGGTGADVVDSLFFAAGTNFRGQDGGAGVNSAQFGCIQPADGGDGMRMVDSTLYRFDSSFVQGQAGAPGGGCPSTSADGQAIALSGSTDTQWNEQLRTLEVGSPAFEGQLATTTFTGQAGENVLLLISLAPENTLFPAVHGVLFGAAPLIVIPLGLAPASGSISFSFTIPVGTLPAAIDGLEVFEQCFVGGSSGFGLTSSPSALVIVR